ncbi:MAG: hypothetical protein AAFR17_12365 [Pseudomonadota bacterium]
MAIYITSPVIPDDLLQEYHGNESELLNLLAACAEQDGLSAGRLAQASSGSLAHQSIPNYLRELADQLDAVHGGG